MARDKTDKTDKSLVVTSPTPKKVAGLLDAVVAEANGEEWEYDGAVSDSFTALATSQRKQELITKGELFEIWLDMEMRLKKLKPGKGRPKKGFLSIDVERAAAVLGADDLWRNITGKGAPTQKAAMETAAQIDEGLVEHGLRCKPLFDNMTSLPTLQNSVSRGLKALGIGDGRFTK